MDTTTVGGISLDKSVRVLNRSDILNHDVANALMLAVYDYIKVAKDFETTPQQTWEIIRDSILDGDLTAITICHMVKGIPQGFMYCKLEDNDPQTAVIHCAYAKSHTPSEVVAESMKIYEEWARFNKATKGRFYTFRAPGAHRLMLQRGWRHMITSYSKEL